MARITLSRTELLTKQSRDARRHESAPVTLDRGTGDLAHFLIATDATDIVDPSKRIRLTLEHFWNGEWSHKASIEVSGRLDADVLNLDRGFLLDARRLHGRDLRLAITPLSGTWNVGASYELIRDGA